MKFKRKSIIGLLVAMGIVLLPFVGQVSANPYANVVLSVDIDTIGNRIQIDDGNTWGSAVAGTDIVVEIFVHGLTDPIISANVTFDTNMLTVKDVFLLGAPIVVDPTTNTIDIFSVPGTSITLTNGYLATVTLTPRVDVTASTQFEVGVRGKLSISRTKIITSAMPLSFNAQTTPTAADADFNGDGVVGVSDFLLFMAKFGTSQGDGEYEAKYDLDGDGQIGVSDFLVFVDFFGQRTVTNRTPVLQRIGDQSVFAGLFTLILKLIGSDPDGNPLTYSVSGNPEGSSLSGNTFSWTPTSGQAATYQVTFTVSDGRGGTDSETITLSSVVPNEAPVLQRIGDQSVPAGVTLTLVLNASDPNGDPLTYSVSGNPEGSSLSGNTFSWTPTSGQAATYQVTFTVSDGRGGTDSETITLSSVVPNEAPVLQRIGDQSVPAGVTLTLVLNASDPNGDPLTYSVSGNPEGSSLSGNTFSWTPTSGQAATYQVTFTVSDGRGGTDSETITLRVVDTFQFQLIRHEIETELPSFVNILFEVRDSLGHGVNYLTTDYFEVRENGQPVSPTESAMNIRKRDVIPYSLKTVLMLDTSTSVEPHLEQIKRAAITLVRNMTDKQEIALYEFSDKPVLLQNFTDDVGVLTEAIRRIRLGFATTNLYGSIVVGCGQWRDIYTTTAVQQGFMIILTDGSDTQGSSTLSAALRARGNRNHTLTLGVKGNQFNSTIEGRFNSRGFYSVRKGVFVNASPSNSEGIEELMIARGDSVRLQAVTYLGARSPQYSWESSNSDIVVIEPDPVDASMAQAIAVKGSKIGTPPKGWTIVVKDSSQTVTLTVFDQANGLGRQVEVQVEGQVEVLVPPPQQGVFVNASPSNTERIEELMIARGDSVRLQAVTYLTYLGGASPQYRWESSNSSIVKIATDPVDASMAWVIAVESSKIGTPPKGWTIVVKDSLQTATLTVFDQANGLGRQVEVQVEGQVEVLVELPPSHTFTLLGGASLEMVWIEPGTFQMGSPDSERGRLSNEGPVHRVTISQGFYLGKYEVTQGQWESVMGTRPWQGEDNVRSGSDYPAVYVSWEDAQEFIRRLNTSLSGNLYRLPTEAEWEYACRAGTMTRWSFGDDESQLTHYAWYSDNSWDVGGRYGHSVGTKRANPWGLYDLHGNVWEWVKDRHRHDYYRSSPSVDPQGPSSGSRRVIRGGAYHNYAQELRSAIRTNNSPSRRRRNVGFRLLRQGP